MPNIYLKSAGSLVDCRAFIRSFAKEVRVKGEEAEIIYTIPLQAGGLLEEQVGVLPTVYTSGAEGIRTPDLRRAKAALSQLSYSPKD